MLDRFHAVSFREPCKVCGKPDWCIVSNDGAVAICMRVESSHPMRSGGWLHRLADDPRPAFISPPSPRPERPRDFDAASVMAGLRLSWAPELADGLATDLGLSVDVVEALGSAYDFVREAFAFPMRDGDGNIVGIRLRNREGRKWAIRGSKQGLFYSLDLRPDDEGVVYVLEGPTDTMAALFLGLPAVGRPSCSGGLDDLRALLLRLRVRRVVVISDNDSPKERPDGTLWRPGQLGASSLCEALGRPFKIVLPPLKDFRAWVLSGLTRPIFDCLVRSQKWNFSKLVS